MPKDPYFLELRGQARLAARCILFVGVLLVAGMETGDFVRSDGFEKAYTYGAERWNKQSIPASNAMDEHYPHEPVGTVAAEAGGFYYGVWMMTFGMMIYWLVSKIIKLSIGNGVSK